MAKEPTRSAITIVRYTESCIPSVLSIYIWLYFLGWILKGGCVETLWTEIFFLFLEISTMTEFLLFNIEKIKKPSFCKSPIPNNYILYWIRLVQCILCQNQIGQESNYGFCSWIHCNKVLKLFCLFSIEIRSPSVTFFDWVQPSELVIHSMLRSLDAVGAQ